MTYIYEQIHKIILHILRGTSDNNIAFTELCQLLIHYKYKVVIQSSDEDEAFIAELPELPGCAADGATYAEVIANAEVIIGEWIETAQALGRLILEPEGRLVFAGSSASST